LLGEAGFIDVGVESQELMYDFSSADEVVNWHAINPTIMSLFAGQSEDSRRRAWQAVVDAAAARADELGHVLIPSEVLYAHGRRPGG
jgi:hypothetical protein